MPKQSIKNIKLGVIYRDLKYNQLIRKKERTLVFTGCSRGGTSALGIMARALGVPMGSDANSKIHEDVAIMNALRDNSGLESIITKRNLHHDIWGFKLPEATFKLKALENMLRQSIFVFVFRNPLAVAKSVCKREPTAPKNFDGLLFGLKHSIKWYDHFITNLDHLSSPCVLLEYEKIIEAPEQYVQLMAEICGASYDSKQLGYLTSLISSRCYKNL